MGKILVVEEEEKLGKFIESELQCEGYDVSVCQDGKTGLSTAKKSNPDLVLLDSTLPNLSGLEVCRRLRAKGSKVPIILLTAKDELNDRVAGLDAGADDYIIKPFSIEQLLTIIRVHIRPVYSSNTDVLTFWDLSLNRRTHEVTRGDRLIELTATEYDLLEYLMSNPRQVLTRDQILEKVWGYDFGGDSNIIEVYVRYLRLKLEANHESRLIQTVRGVGYVLKD